MNQVYLQTCRTFSDAMNKLRFELSVPEYYETAVPEYFRRRIEPPKPIVNGMEVEWDEYLETHPGEKPESFIPNPIYKSEELNRAIAKKTCAEIIDLIINDVEFEVVRFEDIELIIAIFDGYYEEIKSYIPLNPNLKMFTDNMSMARIRLLEAHNDVSRYRTNKNPFAPKGPLSLLDILNRMR